MPVTDISGLGEGFGFFSPTLLVAMSALRPSPFSAKGASSQTAWEHRPRDYD
jgi:hypothetical protein